MTGVQTCALPISWSTIAIIEPLPVYPLDQAVVTPVGVKIVAISFDTIGHRSAYKQALKRGEALVHHITIAAGISSCVLLCLAYTWPEFLKIPALCMVGLSVFYSIIDEGMHWFRFYEGNSDRIEMWSHFFIFVGHTIQIATWSYWFLMGYPGVKETLQYLP